MKVGIYIGSTEEDEVFYNGKLHSATRANNLPKPPLSGNWVKITASATDTCGLLVFTITDIMNETDTLPLVTRNLKGLLKTKDSIIVLPSSTIWSRHFGQVGDKMKAAATLQKDQSYTASLTWLLFSGTRRRSFFELLKSSDAQLDAQNAIFKKYEAENLVGARATVCSIQQPAVTPVEVKNKEINIMVEEDEWVTGVVVKHSVTGRDLVMYNEKYGGVIVKYQQHTVITINQEAIRPTAGMLARFTLKKGRFEFEPEPRKVEMYQYQAEKVDYLAKDKLQKVVDHQNRRTNHKNACTLLVDAMARYDGVHFVVYTKGPPKERLLTAIDPHRCVQEPDRRTEYILRLACFYRDGTLMWKVISMLKILSQNAALLERVIEFVAEVREEPAKSGQMEARANLRSSLQEIGLNAPMALSQRFAGPNIEIQRPTQATKVTEERRSLSNEQRRPGVEILKPAYVSEKWKHHKSEEGWHYGWCYIFYDRDNKQEQLKVVSTSNQRFMASYSIREKNKVMGHWIEFKERDRFAEQMTVLERKDFPKCRLMLKRTEIELELTYRGDGKKHLFKNDLIGDVILPDFGGKYTDGATYLLWFLVDAKMYPARSEFPRIKNVMTDCQWGTGEYSDSEDTSEYSDWKTRAMR
ncbi:unnamed protein product, partial [Mesorhabditis belari]|uniref:Uncharacterized protein n=1 Tax=Mesorhabditis belari TaxID=2138241 RepID=A0AAF3EVM5_9BILA